MSMDARPSDVRRRAFYIFIVSATLFGLGQFHRLSGAVTLPPIAADLGLGIESLGFVAAALFFTSAFLQIPNGLLLDRYGARRVMPAFVGFAVIGCLMLAWATTYEEVLISRMLLGGGFSVTMMSAYVLFAKWYPVEKFATVASWMMAASSLGSILSSWPLAYFIDQFGWRPAYLIVAGVTVVAMIVAVLVIRDAPPGYRKSNKQPTTLRESLTGYSAVLKFPRFFFLLAMGFVAFAPATALLGMWGGPYLASQYQLDGVEAGQILFAMVVAIPVGALVFGPMDRFIPSRKVIVLTAVAAEIVAFLILGLTENLPLWGAVILLIAIAFLQQHYVVLAAHCRAAFPDHLVGRANSTLNLTSILGVGFFQSMFGWGLALFPDRGYAISFLCFAVFLGLASFLYLWSAETLAEEEETALDGKA
ncbi:MFS transporter [Sneathiella chinensis]|uniref:MFS transporter n=1 Tax=Sneathiella chinensis TaxID=349750 RepID=A0ABQ5U6D2_9PROT|nr:MFS transporter [Sneathiella chinensis]GLQ06041.1 MFS transporter [Sneathiella chinensis]